MVVALGAGLVIWAAYLLVAYWSPYISNWIRSRVDDHPPPLTLGMVASVLLVVMLAMLAIWKVPQWQVGHSQRLSSKNRFDRENEARKTLAQIIAGIFLLAGLYSSIHTANLQTETLNLQREGQITDRYSKAIEQLGAIEPGGKSADGSSKINLVVRLGGIYALERIAHDSPKDQPTIMEVLTAYLRENSPAPGEKVVKSAKDLSPGSVVVGSEAAEPEPHPRADIQAICAVVGRRDIRFDAPKRIIDLSSTNLGGVKLQDAKLEKANLRGANLYWANLEGADLKWSQLEGAHLEGADTQQADLKWAHLEGAFLRRAHVEAADLRGADLEGADLEEAHLDGADLRGVDLRKAKNLTQNQLDSAYGNGETLLPDRLKRPSSWH
jgi:hypothetical protein